MCVCVCVCVCGEYYTSKCQGHMIIQMTDLPHSPGILQLCQSSLLYGQYHRVLASYCNLGWCAIIRKRPHLCAFLAVPQSILSSRPPERIPLGRGGRPERIRSVHCRTCRSWPLLSPQVTRCTWAGLVFVPGRSRMEGGPCVPLK